MILPNQQIYKKKQPKKQNKQTNKQKQPRAFLGHEVYFYESWYFTAKSFGIKSKDYNFVKSLILMTNS